MRFSEKVAVQKTIGDKIGYETSPVRRSATSPKKKIAIWNLKRFSEKKKREFIYPKSLRNKSEILGAEIEIQSYETIDLFLIKSISI